MNNFQSVRRNRIQTGLSGLMPMLLWIVVIVGAVLNLGLTYLFWMDDQRVHFVMTAVLGATIGMVVYLILALDHPLWGEVSVAPTAFEIVESSMDRSLNLMTPGRAPRSIERRHAMMLCPLIREGRHQIIDQFLFPIRWNIRSPVDHLLDLAGPSTSVAL
jgi:hypothetical protein